MCATQVGTRVEEAANQFADIEKAIRTIIPPDEIETMVDNIGMPISGINMTYNNTGTIGPQDGDIQIKLNEDHEPTADYVRQLREELPAAIPRRDLRVPAGRHRQPDPEFRRAGADRRRRSRGANLDGQLRLRQQAAGARCATFPASPMRASSNRATQPELQRRRRPHPRRNMSA